MGPNILAQAYATNFFVDPSDFTYYPVALAEAKRVQELNGVNSDIEVIVDSRYDALWYYGSDGITPPGKYDFLTVMMHELAHGFGFAHSFSDTLGIGRRGVGPPPLLPMIFDKFCGVGPTYPNANNLLISPNYPDSSAALSQQLRSNNIHFVGRNTWEMRDTTVPAKLYAPPAWKRGSSLSHLDSLMYGTPGNRNSLMVPYRNKAEAVHSPGEIGLEMLEDLGWWTNRIITFTKPVAGIDISLGDSLELAWSDNQTIAGISDYIYARFMKKDPFGSYSDDRYLADPIPSYRGVNNKHRVQIPENLDSGWYKIKFLENPTLGYGITYAFHVSSAPRLERPVIAPGGGYYPDQQNLTMSGPQGSNIHYTLNGTGEPTQNDPLYTGQITTPSNTITVVKAKAFGAGYVASYATEETYYVGTVPPPQFSPLPGTHPNPLRLHITWPRGMWFCWNNGLPNEPVQDPITAPCWDDSSGEKYMTITFSQRIKARVHANTSNPEWSNLFDGVYTLLPNVRIAQIDSSGASFGAWAEWKDGGWTYHPETLMTRPNNPTPFTLLASQQFKPSTTQKYNVWKRNESENFFINHADSVIVNSSTSSMLAHFHHSKAAIIQTQLIEGGSAGGIVNFKDPWLIDSSDAKGSLNRGVKATWHTDIPSPFKPELSTAYKGVFLNENPTWLPNLPNYSVGAPLAQSIGGISATFLGWVGNSNEVSYQNSNTSETPVVFKQPGATATALYKAHLASNTSAALGTNSQRKLSRWKSSTTSQLNGYNLFYESGNLIFSVATTNMGASWVPEKLVSANPGLHRSPSIALGRIVEGVTSDIDVVWHTNLSGTDQIWYSSFDSEPSIPHLAGTFTPHASVLAAPVVARRGDFEGAKLLVACTAANGIEVMKSIDYGLTWSRDTYSDLLQGRFRPSLSSLLGSTVPITYDNGTSVFFDYYKIYTWIGGSTYGGWRRAVEYLLPEEAVPASTSSRVRFAGASQVVTMAPDYGKVGVVWEMREDGEEGTDEPDTELIEGDPEGDAPIPAYTSSVCFQSKEMQYLNWYPSTKFSGANFKSPTVTYLGDGKLLWMWTNGQSIFRSQSGNYGASWSSPQVMPHNGADPQVLIGAEMPTQAVPYAYRTLSGPIYQIAFPQGDAEEEENEEATREMMVRDETSGASLEVEMLPLTATSAGTKQRIRFAAEDSGFTATVDNIEQHLGSGSYAVPLNADSVHLRIRMSSKSASSLGVRNTPLRVRVSYTLNGNTERTVARWRFTSDHSLNKTFRLPARLLRGKQVKFFISVLGLNRENPSLRVSAASVHHTSSETASANKLATGGERGIPQQYGISQNYPNPFNPSTTIKFALPEESNVSLVVYDVLGRKVVDLVNGKHEAGYHSATWDASGVASGVYFARFTATDANGSVRLTKVSKLVLAK